MKIESKYLVLCTLTGFLVVLDQVIKIYVHANFGLGESVVVIQDYFRFTYVRNPGAAFGIFRDAAPLFRQIFFLTMPPIAMGIIVYMMREVPSSDRWQVFSLSLIFGGALGNYIDRLRYGYVIDFLDFHYKEQWSYPAFNVADSAIVCGVILLATLMIKRDLAMKKTAKT